MNLTPEITGSTFETTLKIEPENKEIKTESNNVTLTLTPDTKFVCTKVGGNLDIESFEFNLGDGASVKTTGVLTDPSGKISADYNCQAGRINIKLIVDGQLQIAQ